MTLVLLGTVRAIKEPYMFPLGYSLCFYLMMGVLPGRTYPLRISSLSERPCLPPLLKHMGLYDNDPMDCIPYEISITIVTNHHKFRLKTM